MKRHSDKISVFFELAGARYWTASLLPVFVGTTLPFWLDPPGFKIKLTVAILFLLLTFFGHVGFHLFYVAFREKLKLGWSKKQLFISGLFPES